MFGDAEPRDAKHGQRTTGELAAAGLGECIDLDLGGRDGDEAEEAVRLDRDRGDADVMAKLILSGKAVEEAVEISVAAGELTAIVACFQAPNLHTHAASPDAASADSSNRACMAWFGGSAVAFGG